MLDIFWNYFVGHAVHIINRLPTPILHDHTTYEKLFNKEPDYDSRRSFGYLCYVSTLKRNRTKLDNRVEKGVFIGFKSGVKGYRVYCTVSHKVVVSRDVKFHEHVFPFDKSNNKYFDDHWKESISTEEIQNDKPDNISGERPVRIHNQPTY